MVKKVAASSVDYVEYHYDTQGNISKYISQWMDGAGNLLIQNNIFEFDVNNQLTKWSNEAGYGLYTYQNGRVEQSEHFASNNRKISILTYTFDASKQLTNIMEEIAEPLASGPKQTNITYQYYSNGNLKRMDFAYRNKLTDPFTAHLSKIFVQYDDKKNPEPDGVLGAIIPGVVLLVNNPLRVENISADGTMQGYTRYEYVYNSEGLPLQRKNYIAINGAEQQPTVFSYEY